MLSFFILGLLLLTAMLWMLLERHEQRRAQAGKQRHSGGRLVLAAVGLVTALFSAGMAFLFVSELWSSGGKPYVGWPLIFIVTGLPFLAGALAAWLTLRRRTRQDKA